MLTAILVRYVLPTVLLALGCLAASTGRAAQQPEAKTPAPLAWEDLAGRKYGAADLSGSKATVFLFSSTQCPISNLYVPRMVRLARDYEPRGVRFFLVNSNVAD